MYSNSKHQCVLVICGNRDKDLKYSSKIKWLHSVLSLVSFTTINIAHLRYESKKFVINLFFIKGEEEAVNLRQQIYKNTDLLVVHGACGSLDKNMLVGSIFLPDLSINTKGEKIAFSKKLLKCAKKITPKKYCQAYNTGEILQVKKVIKNFSELYTVGEEVKNTCIEQETAVIAEMSKKSKIKFCAILYISDNLPLQQNLEKVNSDSNLFKNKMIAKRKSLLISFSTIFELLTNNESL